MAHAEMRPLRGTTAEWAANDIVPGDGELALELLGDGSSKLKIGNGTSKWSELPYAVNFQAISAAQSAVAADKQTVALDKQAVAEDRAAMEDLTEEFTETTYPDAVSAVNAAASTGVNNVNAAGNAKIAAIQALDVYTEAQTDALIDGVTQKISQNANMQLTNLFVNDHFENGLTGWNNAGCTLQEDGSVYVVDDSSSYAGRLMQYISYTAEDKFYVRVIGKTEPSSTDNMAFTTSIGDNVSGQFKLLISKSNDLAPYSAVFTPTGEWMGIRGGSGSWKFTGYTKKMMLINLTAIFGTGNEPTKEEMDALIAILPDNWLSGTITLTQKQIAEWSSKRINYLPAVLEKTSYGVYSGLGVTAQSTPDMTVNVATGVIYMLDGRRFAPTANTALAITAADATNPRIDIVYVSSAGVISYLAGTAAASPSAPAVPTGGEKIAEISVAAGATSIVAANITDKRRMLYREAWQELTLLNGWTGYISFTKNSLNLVTVKAYGTVGTVTGGTSVARLPSGYRTPVNMPIPILRPTGGLIIQPKSIYTDTSGWICVATNGAELTQGETFSFNFSFFVEASV